MEVTDDRHWEKIRKLCNTTVKINNNTKLSVVWNLKLFESKDTVDEITD